MRIKYYVKHIENFTIDSFFKQFKNQLCTNKLIFNAFDYKHL